MHGMTSVTNLKLTKDSRSNYYLLLDLVYCTKKKEKEKFLTTSQCLNIILAQMKKTRWSYFKTWTSSPADFLKCSSFVTLITVELTSAAVPPLPPSAGPLLLLLPGWGARQGRAACLHGWEALLEGSDVSSACFSKLAPILLCLCSSLSLQFLFSHS